MLHDIPIQRRLEIACLDVCILVTLSRKKRFNESGRYLAHR